MADPVTSGDFLTLAQIQEAAEFQWSSGLVRQTPLIRNADKMFSTLAKKLQLYLKCENMQTTGSFKIRGISNQLRFLPDDINQSSKKLVATSAGNFGKAFAYMLQQKGLPGIVVMPTTCPYDRVELIKGFGLEVRQTDVSLLDSTAEELCRDGQNLLMFSYNDINLMAGHASVALEVLKEVPDPDIVVVNCGGGGLLGGIASAIRLSGLKNCRVYGIEPETSNTMHESFKQGHAVRIPTVKSIASGLSPPSAGAICYQHCRRFVDDIILVSDAEIIVAMKQLYSAGLVVEPAGSAGLAALLHGKIPDTDGKKVVLILSGGNTTPSELVSLFQR